VSDPDGPAPIEGRVVAILPRGLYRVGVSGARELIAHAPGGPGRNFVRLVVGDRVLVSVSPRDVTRGRIVGKKTL
jgi:translation initiation factor IF-1